MMVRVFFIQIQSTSCEKCIFTDNATSSELGHEDNDDGMNINAKSPEPKKKKTIPRILNGTFYEIISESGDKVEAKCNECFQIKKGSFKSTGNFIVHYKNKHPNEYSQLDKHIKCSKIDGEVNLQQRNITEHFPPLTTKEVDRKTLLYSYFFQMRFVFQISNKLLDFIIDTNSPYQIVNSSALHTLLETIGRPKIQLPSRPTFMRHIGEQFTVMKTKLIKLHDEQKYVCLTCDVWSSRACSFLGITVLFFTSEFKYQSYWRFED